MRHMLYIITVIFLCSCSATKSQHVIKNSDSTPPPEGFIPLAPPVIKPGSPEDYMDDV